MRGIGLQLAVNVGRDRDNTDGLGWAGLDAGRRFANPEALLTHVAFADDAEAFIVFRHIVRTFQNAVLAADALIIEMAHDPGDRILFIGENRTAVEAAGVGAMMAGGRDRLLIGRSVRPTGHESNIAPRLVFIESIESVAGGDAGLAAGAGIQVDFEGVLFAGLRF